MPGNMPTSVVNWLIDFAEELNTAGPTEIATTLVMLGVNRPGNAEDLGSDWFKKPVNQKLYNTWVWRLVRHRIQELRKVFRRDLGTGNSRYGRIMLKSYCTEMLDNFLVAKPNPDWVQEVPDG